MEYYFVMGFVAILVFMAASSLLNKSPMLAVIIILGAGIFLFNKMSLPPVPTKPPVTQQQPSFWTDFWKNLPTMKSFEFPKFNLGAPSMEQFGKVFGFLQMSATSNSMIGRQVQATGLSSTSPDTVLTSFCTSGYTVTFPQGTPIYQMVQGEQTLYFQYGTASITGVCYGV
jgi:hypothetical protein